MNEALTLSDILSVVYSSFLLTGGLLCFFLRPMEDAYELSDDMRRTVNRRYIIMRHIVGACLLLFAAAGYMGKSPAESNVLNAYPLYITLMFVVYAEAILTMCDAVIDTRRLVKRLCLLIPLVPLAVLAVRQPEGVAIVYAGWSYLILLSGVYTMRFFSSYKFLSDSCCNTIELGDDYDRLPDSMPWVARLYIGAVMLSVFSSLSALVESEWSMWLSVAAHIVYFVCFLAHFIFTFPLYSKVLAHYQTQCS